MRLSQLLAGMDVVSCEGDLEVEVGAVTRDSREVQPGDVFVAIQGARVDGHDLARELGQASAVVVSRPVEVPPGVVVVQVHNTKRALALLAAARHGHPSTAVRVVGVTGTNGKTTVTTLVEGALLALGERVARIGTTGFAVDGRVRPSRFTTPEAPALQAFLAELRDQGVETLLMEVSSIGLAQHRVDGIAFHAAAFTNLTQDHLDFHGTMAEYRAAKARLFADLLRPPGGSPRALLYADDPASEQVEAPADSWTYGFEPGANLEITSVAVTPKGTRLTVRTPDGGEVTLRSPMIGRHNAANLVCALGLLGMLGVDASRAASALGEVVGVPGRLEVVPDPGGERLVVVDYAHTPDALEHALHTMREVTHGRLWVVFGCGGARDAGKRPAMGTVADILADEIVVTNDNPRTEEPRTIADQILAGFRSQQRPQVVLDRREAIRRCVGQMNRGDSLLIAGKGHETYQETNGVRTPFDDRVEARAALEGGSP